MRRLLTATPTTTSLVRAFHFPSYEQNALISSSAETQLDAYRAQIPTATHASLAVHLRTPSNTSNSVSRGPISENPSNLVPWFNLVRSKGLKPALLVILFVGEWDWAGYWTPTNPTTALTNFYTAIRPWVQAAATANVEWIILVDEWSELVYSYSDSAVVPAFTSLYTAARADYSGPLSININQLEETSCKPGIVALSDFIGVTAYAPLTNQITPPPTYAEMRANLLGTSAVTSVRSQVEEYRGIWGDTSVVGYMTYLRHMAEVEWKKPTLLTFGCKNTPGGAADPAGDIPETTVDNVTQDRAWHAFIDAARDSAAGVGPLLKGFGGWRWHPTATSELTGYTPQGKPAAATISSSW